MSIEHRGIIRHRRFTARRGEVVDDGSKAPSDPMRRRMLELLRERGMGRRLPRPSSWASIASSSGGAGNAAERRGGDGDG